MTKLECVNHWKKKMSWRGHGYVGRVVTYHLRPPSELITFMHICIYIRTQSPGVRVARGCSCRAGGLCLIPGWSGHKNLLSSSSSDYFSFRRAVKRQRLHTLRYKAKNSTTTFPNKHLTVFTLELDLDPLPPDVVHSFPPEWPMAPSVVYLRKSFPPTSYT